jgi:hypothetical protein
MFLELDDLKQYLRHFQARYWVAGGWAIDLHLGRKTREHKDIEIALDRREQAFLLQLPEITKVEYIEHSVLKLWQGEELFLPIHELYCTFHSGFVLEVLLNEFEGDFWLYRRNKNIRLHREKFVGGQCAPLPLEVVLLYKAKHCRAQDEVDFSLALAHLNRDEKRWLYEAIALDMPEHPWLGRLGAV